MSSLKCNTNLKNIFDSKCFELKNKFKWDFHINCIKYSMQFFQYI